LKIGRLELLVKAMIECTRVMNGLVNLIARIAPKDEGRNDFGKSQHSLGKIEKKKKNK
jgi:hypothetical protein